MPPLDEASFVILDAARMGDDFHRATALQPGYECLYHGESRHDLASVAPYVFPFQKADAFAEWLLREGWGGSWGCFLVSKAGMNDLCTHLRKFLIVKTEDNKEMYFRYYDPRALRVTLPSLDSDQLREMFGVIDAWLVEDLNSSALLEYRINAGALQKSIFPFEPLSTVR